MSAPFRGAVVERKMERLASIAAELVSLKPDVVVVGPNTSILAMTKASRTIPIVTTYTAEPVANSLVASLARPGGNITGLTSDVTDETYGATKDATERLDVTVTSYEVRNISDFGPAFSSISTETDDGMIVFSDGLTYARRQDFIDFAARAHLPTMYGSRESVDDGGLISYGVNLAAIYRRAATFVDKILKGANPGDLPIEQPAILELVVNIRTAKAIGLSISEKFLLRADEVIE